MGFSLSDVTSLLAVTAWPLVVICAVFFLRTQLTELISSLSGRVTSLGIGSFSIELTPIELSQMPADFRLDGQDLSGLTAEPVISSTTASLFFQLHKQSGAEFVLINLKNGSSWLSSRLFLFAAILGKTQNIRAFVFVRNDEGGTQKFVGIASCESIQSILATKFPRFDSALIAAREDDHQFPTEDRKAYLNLETAEPQDLQHVTHTFIHKVQGAAPLGDINQHWLEISGEDGNVRYEYAHWVTQHWLEQTLGNALSRSQITQDFDETAEETRAKILRRKGDLVAVVDHQNRFVKLIDRKAMLERVAPKVAEVLAHEKG